MTGDAAALRTRAPKLVFTVAVTGHRVVADAAKVGAAVSAVLDACAARIDAAAVPHVPADGRASRSVPLFACAGPPELRFLSALARGADLAATEAALVAKRWTCEAILPFAIDDYAATFEGDTAAVDRMRAIAGSGIACMEIADRRWPIPPDTGHDKRWRERRYALLGQFLVRRADLLIAVWDGCPTKGPGGTADVVLQAWRSGVPIVWIHAQSFDVCAIDPATGALVPDVIDDPARYVVVGGADPAIDRAIDQSLFGRPDPGDPDAPTPADNYVTLEEPGLWLPKGSEAPVAGSNAFPYALLLWGVQKDPALRRWPFRRMRPARHYAWPAAAARDWRASWHRWFVIDLTSWTGAKFGPTPMPDTPPPTAGDAARLATETAVIDDATRADAPMLPFFARADMIATRLSHRYRSGYVVIFALAALAVLLAGAWLVVEQIKVLFVIAEIMTIGAILFIWAELSNARLGPIRGNNTHQRFIDARFLGESVRGAQPLSWIGFAGRRQINDAGPPHEEARHAAPEAARKDEHGGRRHQPRLWMHDFANAVMALPALPHLRVTPREIAVRSLGLINIMMDQKAYHDRNQRRLERLHEALDNAGFAAVMGAALVSAAFVAAAIGVAAYHGGDWSLLVDLERLEEAGGEGLTLLAHLAALAGSVGPALAAAMAGIRYHGDFERFAERSRMTGHLLDQLAARGWALWRRAGACEPGLCPDGPPLFEELYELMLDTQSLLDEDLLDWRFAYQARPLPLP